MASCQHHERTKSTTESQTQVGFSTSTQVIAGTRSSHWQGWTSRHYKTVVHDPTISNICATVVTQLLCHSLEGYSGVMLKASAGTHTSTPGACTPSIPASTQVSKQASKQQTSGMLSVEALAQSSHCLYGQAAGGSLYSRCDKSSQVVASRPLHVTVATQLPRHPLAQALTLALTQSVKPSAELSGVRQPHQLIWLLAQAAWHHPTAPTLAHQRLSWH